jgi:drug/metabolite transporter (DMT)-like permease
MNTPHRVSALLGALLVVMSSVVFATYGVWTVLMAGYFDNVIQAVLRSFLVVALLLPIAWYRHELVSIRWRRDIKLIVGLFLSTALIPGPIYYAMSVIGVGLGTAAWYASTIIGAFLFGWLVAGERLTRDKLVSMLLGMSGLWLIFAPTAQHFGIAAIMAAIVSGLAVGLTMIVDRQLPYSAAQTTLMTWTSTLLINIPLVWLLHEQMPLFAPDIHWIFLLCFSCASALGSWLLIAGLKQVEAGAAGILGLMEIVFAVIFGIMIFRESLTPMIVAGIGAIMAAAAIPYIQDYNTKRNIE